jgi:hypothetical protein
MGTKKRRVDAGTIIIDLHAQRAGTEDHGHPDETRSRVPIGIADCLATNLQKLLVGFRAQASTFTGPDDIKAHGFARGLHASDRAQRLQQIWHLVIGAPERQQTVSALYYDRPRLADHGRDFGAAVARNGGVLCPQLQAKQQGLDTLHQRVMEFTCDALALLVTRVEAATHFSLGLFEA